MSEPAELPWAPMVDATGLSFQELLVGDCSAMEGCLERLIRGLDDPDGIISAFQNFAS